MVKRRSAIHQHPIRAPDTSSFIATPKAIGPPCSFIPPSRRITLALIFSRFTRHSSHLTPRETRSAFGPRRSGLGREPGKSPQDGSHVHTFAVSGPVSHASTTHAPPEYIHISCRNRELESPARSTAHAPLCSLRHRKQSLHTLEQSNSLSTRLEAIVFIGRPLLCPERFSSPGLF
jgi:hypothetical protein